MQIKNWILSLLMLLVVGNGWGQSASATWALTSAATASITGNVTGGSQTGGTGIGLMSYTANGVSSNGWGTTGLDANDYYQFSIAPTSGNNLTISSIATTNNLSSQTATGQIQYSYSSSFTSPTTVGSTFALSSTAATNTFSSLSISVSSIQTLYVRIFVYKGTGDGITNSQTVRCKDFTVSGTTTPTATPSIAISTAHPAIANIAQGSTSNIIAAYQLDVTTANATLTGVSITTAGTCTSSDIATNGFKFWINSSVTTSGATQLGTSQPAVNSGGTVAVSGLSQSITSGTTRYILVTADIANSAVTNNAISLMSTAFSNITFISANKTGTDPAGASNAQTIIACTGANVTGVGATNGNTNSSVSWASPSCYDEIMIVARAGSANDGTPSGDGSSDTANLIFSNGTALGSGFVVYKGSTSPQVVTGLTNGIQYFFKIFTRKGTTWTSGVEVNATPAAVTSATDYFRSNVRTGNWATAGSWQSSVDSSTWITSTLVPSSTANSITIRNGDTITIAAAATIDQVVILNGGVLNFSSTSIVVNNGTGDDIVIQNGGKLSYANSGFSYNTSATVNINTGGILSIDIGGITGSGAAIHQTSHIYSTGSILQYTLTSQPSASGVTYFPNVDASTVPIFRFTQNLVGNVGGGSATVINGLVQYGSGVTSFGWSGAGLKTFRNGMTTLGTTSVTATSGILQIGDANVGTAEIGGSSGVLSISSAGMSITANCTATLSSNVTLSAGTLTNNGILTCGTNVLSGAGAFTNAASGTVITSNTGGVNTTIGVSGTKTYSAGSSFTFNANTSTPFPSTIASNQIGTLNVNANVTSNYASNLIITTACNINSGIFSLNGTNHLLLNNAVPLTIANGATFNNGGESQIQINSGTPTIALNGTFITQDAQGFTGPNTAIPSITPTLGASSTIEYGLAGDQIVTSFAYKNLVLSNSGTKTSGTNSSIESLIISGSAILDAGTSTIGSSSTNLTMTGTSKFIIGGSGTRPTANGIYSLANTSTIEFAGSSAKSIRQAPTYGNIQISGSAVSAPSSGLTLQSGSTFTVTSTGTFLVTSSNGLYASSNAAVLSINSPSLILSTGSTVNYSGTTQNITNTTAYSNLTISGSGVKTPTGAFTVNGIFTRSGTASLANTSPVYGTGASLAYVSSTDDQTYTAGLEWPSSNVPSNITVNLSGAGTTSVTMPGNRTVAGVLALTAGKLSLSGNTLTLNGTVSGMSASNSLIGSNSSRLNVTSSSSVGTVYFDQTTDGNILNPTSGTNSLKDIVTTGTGTLTLGNKVNLFERLSVGSGTTLNTGDSLVLRSIAGTSSNNTAYVDVVGGTINGQARVERYVHKQYRGWRAITSPVTYNGINQGYVSTGWQNSWGLSGNYGTRITGPSATNGIDDVSFSSSLKTYNSGTGAWNEITNTTTETLAGNSGSADNKAFFMFVRGDRTVTPNGYNPNSFVPTTLAARGKLQTGNQMFTFTGAANKAWLIGNPYACPVDMSAVTFGGSVPNFVYVWDPNLASSYSDVTGNYVTFDRSDWAAGAPGSSITQYFQSGQCFFIVPTTTTASVTFHEGDKNPTQNDQTAGVGNGSSDMFNVKLSSIKTDGSRSTIDGIRAKFGSSYSTAVDADDATKWSTTGLENMSLKRGTSLLTIEARPYITTTDTLFLNLTSLSAGSNYEFKVNPVNFDASVSSCKLVDRFLNTETPISLNSTTLVGFNVTSVTGSNAAGRFFVVFNATGNLPTSNSLTVKAYKQNNSVKIDWEAIAENNVKTYTVEKSTDATSFNKLTEATAKNGNTTNAYSFTDNNPVIGVNYYRIQSTQSNNNKVYSTIVRVEMSDKGIKSITVYPNPVKSSSNVIGLQMSNLTADVYTAKLYNVAGQQVWMNTINHNGNNGSTNLQLNKTLASGTYQLQLTDTKGSNYQQTVLVVE